MKTYIIYGVLAAFGLSAMLFSYISVERLTTTQQAIIQSLGVSGILEQSESGEIQINQVVRLKDIQK